MAQGSFWGDLDQPKQAKGDFWAGLDQPRTTEAYNVDPAGNVTDVATGKNILENIPKGQPPAPSPTQETAPPPMERLRQAARNILPFPGIVTAGETPPEQRNLGTLLEGGGMPRVVQQLFGAVGKGAEKLGLAKDFEAAMAVAPFIPRGARPAPGALQSLFRRPGGEVPVQDVPPARPGLPPPPEQLALPSVSRPALPEPANMVMEAGQLQTPGGATMPGPISRQPARNVVDLIEEVKQDVKQRVIDDIFEELRTGRTAAMPRREAPAQIAAPRRLSAETTATSELAQDFAPKAPAIELPPPERPKIIMGKQGYRGAPETPAPMRELGPAVIPEALPEMAPRPEAPTIQDLLAKSQAKADKSIEKLGIGQRKQPVRQAELPEEPPFEIPSTVQKETPARFEPTGWQSQLSGAPEGGLLPEVQQAGIDKVLGRMEKNGDLLPTRVVQTPNGDAHIEYKAKRSATTGRIRVTPEGEAMSSYPGEGVTIRDFSKPEPPQATFTKQAIPPSAKATGGVPEAGPAPEVQPVTGKRTPLDILKEETGALKLPRREDPMAAIRAPHEMGTTELARKSFTKRTSKIFEDMGPTGKKMGEELADAYYTGEQRAGKIASDLDKIKAKYPNVKGEDLFQVESGKARPDVAAAYREIKAAITDPIGDEAVSLKIKVKNPITDVERAFQKRQRYVPHLIDPAKVAKNPTRLVDTIMEELIAEGIDPGKARTQAIQTVRNVSKKSGSLQYARTGKFDPDIHVTDGWEAYKRAAQGEVKRIEMLKRFGKTDEADLLGDEIGGIRDRTANISAEAGPEAAQKAELWATRQIGMQRGEIDTVQKKAGELARNYNTLKLGFMPVTNLAAQMPMIMAAGKTTRFNPIKSLNLIRKSFGESGEGAELAKLFGTANDKFSADLLQKFETARGGPGGSAAAAFLHVTGGMKSENFIAKLAAQVGNEEAKYVIQKLIDNPASKSAQNTIRRYGLDPAKVIQDGATEQNIFRVARKFSDEVLLRGNVLDLPPAFTSESGKVFFQFKRATQVLGQQMYDAAKNDPSKLIALLAASQIGGETLLDVKAGVRGTVAALVSGDPKKITDELKLRPQGVRRILDNWAAALSFGYFGDTVMDVASGVQPKNIISGASVVASPFESGLHVTQGAGKIARGEKGGGKQMLGGLLREVPGGTYLRGLTRPEKSANQRLLEDLGLSKMLKENRAARRELKEQLGLDE